MKTKLHFGILALLLAFLGTFLEQKKTPNQQIVIQFSDKEITSQDTENAIEDIQKKLQSIGVSQIQIGQNKEGQLRITYHSEADVAHIKNVLFNVEDFNIAYNSHQNSSTNFPEDKTVKDYELNISEIKSSSDSISALKGIQVAEVNPKTDHSNQIQVHFSGKPINYKQSNSVIKVAISVNNSVAIALDNLTYKIPEVRAGPTV